MKYKTNEGDVNGERSKHIFLMEAVNVTEISKAMVSAIIANLYDCCLDDTEDKLYMGISLEKIKRGR